jgi:hypothetical protein
VVSPSKDPTEIEAPSTTEPVRDSKLTSFDGTIPKTERNVLAQAKLEVESVDDPQERQADDVAEQVMRMSDDTVLRRAPAEDDDEANRGLGGGSCAGGCVQRTEATGNSELPQGRLPQPVVRDGQGIPAPISNDIAALRSGGGAPLPRFVRRNFEGYFGQDLSQVRVHAGEGPATLAQQLRAKAFTLGHDVVFGRGQFQPETDSGKRLLAHELTHVMQQRGSMPHRIQRAPAALDSICYDPKAKAPHGLGNYDPRRPEDCPTYEIWLETFRNLKTFQARDTAPGGQATTGFSVLGQNAADQSNSPTTKPEQKPAPFIKSTAADAYIDHPTDNWIQSCLPANLRETAYRLPSDCADIAVILRHVWLSAHHRTEKFGQWTIGDKAGGPNTANVGKVIQGVGSINVAAMLNPYLGNNGTPLKTFAALAPRLHPGDVLVWEHHGNGIAQGRTGGHTQTITNVNRDASGTVTSLDVLQGNQPIFVEQAKEIRTDIGKNAPTEQSLRDSPGRRIETSQLVGEEIKDRPLPAKKGQAKDALPELIWMWDDTAQTTLVAAGPPAAVHRPAVRNKDRQPRISDWFKTIDGAGKDNLETAFEAALLELRGLIESGAKGLDPDATGLGQHVGNRLFNLAKSAKDFGEERLYRPIERIRLLIFAIANPVANAQKFSGQAPAKTSELERVFRIVDSAFNLAARGASSVSFARTVPKGNSLLKVLVTGFDPFKANGPVAPGTINPSGAAALALDGTVIKSGKLTVAVEAVVLPVSFDEFESGLVESIIRPLIANQGVDAVLTVSLDESLASSDPVRLERFVVGVHDRDGTLGPIAAAAGAGVGPVIIETPAPVEDIARETAQPATKKQPAILQPTIGTAIEFRFASATRADQALQALKLPLQHRATVSIDDVSALRQIVSTMQRTANGFGISFDVGKEKFQASVLSGPGGDFLSNEVSFRALRLLAQSSASGVTSFHVHTGRALAKPGDVIPPDLGTKESRSARAAAIASATQARATLVATLQRMILAIAKRSTSNTTGKKP